MVKHQLQVIQHLTDLLVTIRWLLHGTFQNDPFKAGRDVGKITPGRCDFLPDMHKGDAHGILTVKGYSSGSHLIHSNSQGINITFLIRVIPSGLFGGQIMDRTHQILGDSISRGSSGNSKVRHLYLPAF